MTTPGSNTFALAMSVQGKQTINYYAAIGRTVNSIGLFEGAFAPPVPLKCAVQPIQRSLYEQLGLDLQKNYVTLYIKRNTMDIERGTQGDQFSYAGRRFQLESELDWFRQDGWVGTLCSDIGAEPDLYLSLILYNNPGVTDVSEVEFADKSFFYAVGDESVARNIIIDVPRWTVGDDFYNPIVFGSGLADGAEISVNVAIGGINQGTLIVTADGGEATDAPPDPFPGLSTYGVVAGGLRVQHNVRLTISSSTVDIVDIVLKRGVSI